MNFASILSRSSLHSYRHKPLVANVRWISYADTKQSATNPNKQSEANMKYLSRRIPIRSLCIFSLATGILTACDRQEAVVTESPSTDLKESVAWVDGERIENADAEPQNWLSHGRCYTQHRISFLEQIKKATIGSL
jgi:hypothetical protein